jgi:hypothetical protein
LALPAFAGQPKNLVPQNLPGREVRPTSAASYTIVDGRMVLTSDWIPLNGATTRDLYSVAAFDSAEHDNAGGVLGPPTDNAPGCTAFVPTGNRWFLAAPGEQFPTYTNPFVSADMTTSTGGAGALCEALSISWYIFVGPNEPDVDGDTLPDSDYYIAVQQFEDMDTANCTDDGTNFLDGVIYNFSGNSWDPNFYNYSNITLNADGLFHTMPADGIGGYQVILGVAFDGTNITIPTGVDPATGLGVSTQTMLWGTGNNENPTPQPRAGTEVDGQFDDDAPIDGVHDLTFECYTYAFGVCPDPLAPSVTFWIKDGGTGGCDCAGDIDGSGTVDISDLAFLLSDFGSSTPSQPCSDVDGSGTVDLADLAQLLSAFGSTCP